MAIETGLFILGLVPVIVCCIAIAFFCPGSGGRRSGGDGGDCETGNDGFGGGWDSDGDSDGDCDGGG